jgi:photosystem II stability/assembly factor-like uncharacterized protein/putative cell wall-binding protein
MKRLRVLSALCTIVCLLCAVVPFGASAAVVPTEAPAQTWTPQDSGAAMGLWSVDFVDANTGWVVGWSGTILHTANGGTTWTAQTPNSWESLVAVDFIDEHTGWATGTGGAIMRTTTGGATWEAQTSGTTQQLNSIHFIDADTGWAAGRQGVIVKTDDGGVTWIPQTSGTTDDLRSVHFTDSDNGWAVGDWGTIRATSNGGATWTLQWADTQLPLLSVDFIDANVGWATGSAPVGGSAVILKTMDGGVTWTPQSSGAADSLYSIHFVDANTGWAVGLRGIIVATRDGGTTWIPQASGTTIGLNAVDFVDANTGWAVGSVGTILKMTTAYTGPDITISGLPTGWVNHDVPFSLDATQPGGPAVAATYYRLSPPGTTIAAAIGTVTAEGTTTIDYWSVDVSGNAESTKTATVSIDKTPPTTSSDASGSYVGSATVHFDVADALSGPATTRYVLDGGTLSTGTLVSVTSAGTHTLDFAGMDVAGNADTTHSVSFVVQPTSAGLAFDSVAGAGRYDTAVQACRRAFPASGSADTIVLATGANWPDALGGASLAGAYGGPLLLTKPDTLSSQVLDEARRLNVDRVVILGSTRAVSAAVENALKIATINGHGLTVTRIGGAGRYDTAARIASATVDAMASTPWPYDGTAFFATGGNFPDALAASPIAAAYAWPILLVQPDSPSSFTEAAIAKLGVKKGYMLGSDRAVSTLVETRLKALLPSAPTRLSGATRYDTGIAIARFGVSGGLHWDGVALATGTNFPDALAGGVMQGKLGSVVLLTPGSALNAAVASELTAHKADIATVRYLGSTSALTQPVRDAVEAALK